MGEEVSYKTEPESELHSVPQEHNSSAQEKELEKPEPPNDKVTPPSLVAAQGESLTPFFRSKLILQGKLKYECFSKLDKMRYSSEERREGRSDEFEFRITKINNINNKYVSIKKIMHDFFFSGYSNCKEQHLANVFINSIW